MEIISGTAIADEIKQKLKEQNQAESRQPCLAMVIVGDNHDSLVYVGLKQKALEASGGKGEIIHLPEETGPGELIKVIEQLNTNPAVNGILVQLPLPGQLALHQDEVLAAIDPDKDVDGFTPANCGRLAGDQPHFVSCAALACMEVVERTAADLKDKKILLIGDSFDVIKPLVLMFMARKCQVTVVPALDKELLPASDIIIIEKGKPLVLKGEHLKDGALVIDAGFYWYHDRMCGNVDINSTKDCRGFLLPVPGGMGPLLIAKLMENLNQAARRSVHE